MEPEDQDPVPPIAEDPTDAAWVRREATEGSLENPASGDDTAWSPVAKASDDASAPPPMPIAVKIIGAVIVVLLLAGASWLGLSLGAPEPTPSPSPSPTETIREWPLTAPTVHEDWVQGETSTMEPVEGTERTVVTSAYSNGAERIVLVLSRPETDITGYFADANIGERQEVGDSSCGLSQDTGLPLCVQILDETALLVAGTDGQSYQELDGLVEEFYLAIAGEPG